MAEKEKKKRIYDDDDGRTIADMSGVRRRNLFMPNRYDDEVSEPIEPFRREEGDESGSGEPAVNAEPITGGGSASASSAGPEYVEEDGVIMEPGEAGKFRPWEQRETKGENAAWVLGALSAGLLLVLIFIVAGAIVIGLMLWAWT